MLRSKLLAILSFASVVLAPAVASASVPVPVQSPHRELWQIQRDLGDKIEQLSNVQMQMMDLTGRRLSLDRLRLLKELNRSALAIAGELRALNADLRDALKDLVSTPEYEYEGGFGGVHGGVRPPPVWQPGYPMLPAPLSRSEFAFVVKSIDDATFSSYQINALEDSIRGGAFFDISQALVILGRFPNDANKVDVAARLCPVIVERNALPHLLSAFTFETYKEELRDRTNGMCGFFR